MAVVPVSMVVEMSVGHREFLGARASAVRRLGDGDQVLRYIPHRGMVSTMHDATKQSVSARLKRIEGQVGGLLRMVEEDRYCVDVLTQINAVRAALHKVEAEILRDHVSHCVVGAFASGDAVEQRHKVEELVDTIGRMTR